MVEFEVSKEASKGDVQRVIDMSKMLHNDAWRAIVMRMMT